MVDDSLYLDVLGEKGRVFLSCSITAAARMLLENSSMQFRLRTSNHFGALLHEVIAPRAVTKIMFTFSNYATDAGRL